MDLAEGFSSVGGESAKTEDRWLKTRKLKEIEQEQDQAGEHQGSLQVENQPCPWTPGQEFNNKGPAPES